MGRAMCRVSGTGGWGPRRWSPVALGAAVAALLLLPARAKVSTTPEPPRTELSHQCSRTIARSVRKHLEKEIIKPAVKAMGSSNSSAVEWPGGCPFDPALDLYAFQEKQKQRRKSGSPTTLHTCGICGKAFKTEHYLDLHMERKHEDVLPKNGVCLADYCEVFEVCAGDWPFKRAGKGRFEAPECSNETMKVARNRCEDALQSCFPLSVESMRSIHAMFSRQWCQVLDCRIREEKKKEHETTLIPVVILLLMIILIGFIIFGITVCCVDYSDDIFQFLVTSGLASSGFVRRLFVAREKTRVAVGLDRTKSI